MFRMIKRIFRPEYRIVYKDGIYHLQKRGVFSDWFHDVHYHHIHFGAVVEFEYRRLTGVFIKPKLLYTIYLDSTNC